MGKALPLLLALGLVASTSVAGLDGGGGIVHAAAVSNVASGDWSDPSIWSTGTVPQAGDDVTIAAGTTVGYDVVSDDVLGLVTVNGTLRYSRTRDSRLKLSDNLLVEAGGFLDMGVEGNPIRRDLRAELVFVLPQGMVFTGGPTFKPEDTGLWVFGRWESQGAPLVHTWSKIAADAFAGSSEVIVEDDVTDWYVGGEVFVTSSALGVRFIIGGAKDYMEATKQEERRTIVALSVEPDGSTRITLDQPLSFLHSGTPPFRAEVGHLTRNVFITTELTGATDAVFVDVTKRRFAHTAFMPSGTGNVSYTELKRMGNFGALARYPLHYHMTEQGNIGNVFRGNAVWMSGFRWYTVHDTDGVLVEDNVGFDGVASGFFLEKTHHSIGGPCGTCPEGPTANRFLHNLGAKSEVIKSSEHKEQGAIFWMEHLDQSYIGNVASGAGLRGGLKVVQRNSTAGFMLMSLANGSGQERPLFFIKNESHSNFGGGLRSWNNMVPPFDFVEFSAWRNGYAGIEWGAYGAPYTYHRATIAENGLYGVDVLSTNLTFQDSEFTGSGSDGYTDQWGLKIRGYVAATSPTAPASIVRSSFSNYATGDIKNDNNSVCDDPAEELRAVGKGGGQAFSCTATYIELIGSDFNSPVAFEFGDPTNANSHWKILDRPGYEDIVLLREDQIQASPGGEIAQDLLTASTAYAPEYGALVTPVSELPPQGIDFSNLLDTRDRPFDYTFTTAASYPPQVDMVAPSAVGSTVTLTATASDDESVSSVEFWVNDQLAGTVLAPPYTLTINLADFGDRYAYVYAKATDNDGREAFTEAAKFGPEVVMGESAAANLRVVAAPFFSGKAGPALDLDGDATREDVNGNGRLDFDDVATLFIEFDTPEVQDNVTMFDFNANELMDFADVVDLFELTLEP